MKINKIGSAIVIGLALTVAGNSVSMAQDVGATRQDQAAATTSDGLKSVNAPDKQRAHNDDVAKTHIQTLGLGNRLDGVYGDPEDAARLQYGAGR